MILYYYAQAVHFYIRKQYERTRKLSTGYQPLQCYAAGGKRLLPIVHKTYSWDVSVSYIFSRVETVKHLTIYCGIVKLHWADSALTRELIDKDHMSRGRFRELFKIVFGNPITKALADKLSEAESIRDKIAHEKKWNDAQARKSLIDIFEFAVGFNAFVNDLAGFKPFSNLRGFKGRKQPLPKTTTRWVLLGMGIPGKGEVV